MGLERDYARIVLPHLPAAFRLAGWLLGNCAAAEDLVQDAALRAWHGLDGFRGGSGRAWLLRIVRNLALTELGRAPREGEALDEDWADGAPSPEDAAHVAQGRLRLQEALAALPPTLRECLVLRELEEMSYREIAEVTGVPLGTVMSRLWAARQALMRATEGLRA